MVNNHHLPLQSDALRKSALSLAVATTLAIGTTPICAFAEETPPQRNFFSN